MPDAVFAPLLRTLGRHSKMSKSRLMTLAVLICGVAQARTVNLSHRAGQFPGEALQASNDRRLQRFFQHESLPQEVIARRILSMLNDARPKRLALDRAHWKLGQRDVNVRVLARVTRRFRVPLFWTLLPHQGCSDTGQRIALMQRYLDLFGASSVELLLADRAFIGADWLEFLCKNSIPFAIRLKENMPLFVDRAPRSFAAILRRAPAAAPARGLGGQAGGDALRASFRGPAIARRRGADRGHTPPRCRPCHARRSQALGDRVHV